MGNDIDFRLGQKRIKKPARFLMAYSLNGEQPVQCTLLNEEPYFYMDEEVILDDDTIFGEEEGFDFADLDMIDDDTLQNELVNLKNKIDAYERLSLEFSKEQDKPLQEFIVDGDIVCGKAPQIDADTAMGAISARIEKSRYATELLAFAQKNGIQIALSNQVDTADYDKKAGKIFIRQDLDLEDQTLLVVQELRRHWQHQNGALVHPLTFHPDHAVLINRAQLADLSVAVVRSAWEMKIAGDKECWSRIENSPMSDLGRALAREALSDFRTLNNGKAASAVFETWFLSERCRQQDKKLIQAMLADYRGYMFDSPDASRIVTIDLICALGEQPSGLVGGKNYLAPYAQMIMNDPIFTDVRDRSNANFLWFIKFEREFTETEQELQSSNLIEEPGIQQADNKDIIEDTDYEQRFTRQSKESLRQSIFGQPTTAEDGNIIHVDFTARNGNREGISPV